MGKATSAASKFELKDLAPGGMERRILRKGKALGDEMDPEMPGETEEAKAARGRQAEMLAKLDEDENRRIKNIMAGGRGPKLMRSVSRSSSGGSAGATSSASASTVGSRTQTSTTGRATGNQRSSR